MRRILVQLERPRRAAGAVFALAVLVTLLFQAVLPAGARLVESTDYTSLYSPVAHNILAGHGITTGAGVPATGTPPGYPLILSGLFRLSGALNLSDAAATLALACVAMGICSVLVYAIARSVWGAAPALLAPLIWMTYPFTLWLTKQPNSEIPFLIVFYGAFGLFWSALIKPSVGTYGSSLLTGILVGAATLIRPIAVGAGVAFGAVLWLTRGDLTNRRRVTLVAVLLLGNVAAVLPWETWLYSRTDRVVLLGTNGGASLRDGVAFALDGPAYRRQIKVPAPVELLMQDASARGNELQSSRDVFAFLVGQLWERPLAVGELLALKLARSWYATDTGRHEMAILAIQAGYVLVALWATLVAWRQGGTSKQLVVAVWIVIAYFWAMATLVVPLLRYMVPALGLLFVLLPVLFVRARAASASPTMLQATEAGT